MLPLLILFFIIPSSFGACFNDGVEWQSACYYFHVNASEFLNAEEVCIQIHNGHLASVHDGFTNAFLAQQASLHTKDTLWIGASDLLISGNFSWTDGTPFDFTDLTSSKNQTGKDCIELEINGKWKKANCYKSKPFICQSSSSQNQSSTTASVPGNATFATALPTIPTPQFNCSANWRLFNDSCYSHNNSLHYAWGDAEQYCQNQSAHLASIHSQDENQFLIDTFISEYHYYWIGLHFDNNGATWKWSDNSHLIFTNWKALNPTGPSTCVNFDYDGTWANDSNCTDTPTFICKKSATLVF